MSRETMTIALAGVLCLWANSAFAQMAGGRSRNHAVAFGVGLDRIGSTGILHLSGSYRFNVWGNTKKNAERFRPWRRGSGMKGYLEAEVAYWEDPAVAPYDRDLLLGLNAVAVFPSRSVNVFFGGGLGAHFLEVSSFLEQDVAAKGEKKLGANVHFGADLNITESASFFVLGRFDILEGDFAEQQSKVQVGARYGF